MKDHNTKKDNTLNFQKKGLFEGIRHSNIDCQKENSFQMLWENYFELRFSYPAKLPTKYEGR